MAEHIGWKPALTAALSKVGETIAVEQITLTAPLAYTLPAGTPSGVVHSVVFTQNNVGGHAVTYGGQPVGVDLAPSASTLVEVWPGGKVVYPGAGGAGGGSSTVTADDTPATPAEGESASYLVTSAVTWPAGLVWSTDPDGGVAPTITGTALVSLFTVGGTTRAIMGATFPAVAAPADTIAPTWTATFTMGTPTSSSVVAAVSALATDNVAVTGYEVSYNNGSTWTAITPSGSNFTLAGAAGTTYTTTRLRAKDAAGNTSAVLSVPSYTMAAATDTTPPVVGTMAASAITTSGFTLTVSGASDGTALHSQPYAFTTDNGATWSAYQASAVHVASGLTPSTGYSCNWRVRDAAGNVSTGTAQTVTTGAALVGTLTYRGQSTSSSEVASYTYSAVPLGAESATRQVLVLVTYWSSGSRSVDSVTIGGISATRDYYASALSTAPGFQVWRATVPTGSTADVVAAFGSGANPAAPTLAVWTTDKPVTFLGGNSADGATGATSVSVTNSSAVSGGFAIGGQRSRSNAFDTTFTGLTERYDTAAAQPTCGGDAATTGPATVTATLSVACTQLVRLGLAAYRWGA